MLKWLEKWYKSNCNGDWEHCFGIKISNIDNPGWSVDIDLFDTELENKILEQIIVDNGDEDWFFCKVENNVFKGRGDAFKLDRILEIFQQWQNKHSIE